MEAETVLVPVFDFLKPISLISLLIRNFKKLKHDAACHSGVTSPCCGATNVNKQRGECRNLKKKSCAVFILCTDRVAGLVLFQTQQRTGTWLSLPRYTATHTSPTIWRQQLPRKPSG